MACHKNVFIPAYDVKLRPYRVVRMMIYGVIEEAWFSQSSSDALIVISANIEALTTNKASVLSELCKDKHCHCLCLQETHRAKDRARPSIPGMALVAECPHTKQGSSVFVRDSLKFNSISVCVHYS